MGIAEIVEELRVFASWPQCFTFAELLDFMSPYLGIDHGVIQQALLGDPRFICLRSKSPDEHRFILGSTLFRWFSNLNIRLAQVHQYKLSERQLALLMSRLRCDGQWDTPPTEAVRWGQSLGFVGPSYTLGQYVFPLARILSLLPPSSSRIAADVLKNFCRKQVWKLPLKKLLQESLQEGFSRFRPRVVNIVQARAGLLTGDKQTLEQIGASLKLTRERVRQLENDFWNKLHTRKEWWVRPFLVALLCDFMDESGSLVVNINSPKEPLRGFLAKCCGIPYVRLSQIGLSVLAASSKDFSSLKSSKWFPDEIDASVIANRLESEGRVALTDRDMKVLAESVAQFRRKRLNKAQKVYLALRAIGRPAHYSTIAETYNSLFPDHPSTEDNIHAILSREQCGVVWNGLRGTFALKEWGYERPSKSLYETVADIVQERFSKTGRPVPFTVIAAEISKYRTVVKTSSLAFAAYCNPNLQRVSKDSFIPRDPDDQAQEEIFSEELDRILREFQTEAKEVI